MDMPAFKTQMDAWTRVGRLPEYSLPADLKRRIVEPTSEAEAVAAMEEGRAYWRRIVEAAKANGEVAP